MNALAIVEAVKTRKGTHVPIVWERIANTLQSASVVITKRTEAWIRSGIAYANLSDVKEGIERGERGEVSSLPWGHWREGYVNYIIDHTPKGQTEEVEYIRLYPASFANLSTPKVTWTLNGQEASYEEVEPFLKASEKRQERETLCFTVKAKDVLTIGE